MSEKFVELIVNQQDGTAFRIPLNSFPFVVGRGNKTNLQVDDAKLSRQHFQISINDEMCIIEDLGSLNGILVGNERHRHVQLQSEVPFIAGKTRFTIRITQKVVEEDRRDGVAETAKPASVSSSFTREDAESGLCVFRRNTDADPPSRFLTDWTSQFPLHWVLSPSCSAEFFDQDSAEVIYHWNPESSAKLVFNVRPGNDLLIVEQEWNAGNLIGIFSRLEQIELLARLRAFGADFQAGSILRLLMESPPDFLGFPMSSIDAILLSVCNQWVWITSPSNREVIAKLEPIDESLASSR